MQCLLEVVAPTQLTVHDAVPFDPARPESDPRRGAGEAVENGHRIQPQGGLEENFHVGKNSAWGHRFQDIGVGWRLITRDESFSNLERRCSHEGGEGGGDRFGGSASQNQREPTGVLHKLTKELSPVRGPVTHAQGPFARRDSSGRPHNHWKISVFGGSR